MLPAIEQLFAALYVTSRLIANTEKVSFKNEQMPYQIRTA